MVTEADAADPGEGLGEYVMPPEPGVPALLPSVAPVEYLQGLLDRLDAMDSDHERVSAVRDELRAVRALAKYLTSWRSFYCIRLWLADVPTHLIAKAAGVADTYVSKRAKKAGLPPRRIDRRRDG